MAEKSWPVLPLERMANHKVLLSHTFLLRVSSTYPCNIESWGWPRRRARTWAVTWALPLEGPGDWHSLLLTPSWNSQWFFNKGPCIFILHWAFQITQQVLPGSLLDIHNLRPHLRLLKVESEVGRWLNWRREKESKGKYCIIQGTASSEPFPLNLSDPSEDFEQLNSKIRGEKENWTLNGPRLWLWG